MSQTLIISTYTLIRILLGYIMDKRLSDSHVANRRSRVTYYISRINGMCVGDVHIPIYIEPGICIGINEDNQPFIYGVDGNQDIHKYLKGE